MLLPRITTNVAVWPAEPDGDPLARFLRSLDAFEALPPDTLVLPSHGLPFRGIALRVAQLRAHHDARLAELEAFVAAAPAPLTAADVLPVLFRRAARPAAALLRDGRGDRPPQSPVARAGGLRARLPAPTARSASRQ